MDADTDSPYVWVAGSGNKLEKRDVVLGQYDENLAEYEIAGRAYRERQDRIPDRGT